MSEPNDFELNPAPADTPEPEAPPFADAEAPFCPAPAQPEPPPADDAPTAPDPQTPSAPDVQTPPDPDTDPAPEAPEGPPELDQEAVPGLSDALPYARMYLPESAPLTTPVRRRLKPGLILLGVLLVVAALVIWLVRTIHITVQTDNTGSSVTFSTRDPAEVPSLDEIFDPDAAPADNSPTVATVRAGSGASLALLPPSNGPTLSYQEIYQKVIPSVVSITCTKTGGSGSGTGILMTADGYIITNYHVIASSREINVLTHGEVTYPAALVGGDESSDLAVLKIDATGLTPAEFGASDELLVGDPVLAIGDPLGVELRGTMTDGIISAINRDMDMGDRSMTLIQTNAALNAGNSGGPLVDLHGRVIGINTMKLQSYYTTVEGLGFAIPLSAAKPIVDELLEKGYVSGRPSIGIIGGDVPEYVATFYNLPAGVYIQSVSPNSDAARQGLQSGDIIIAADGQPIASMDELNAIKFLHAAGDTIQLTVFRNGETFDVGLTLMDAALVN